jgi:hypothetical protein
MTDVVKKGILMDLQQNWVAKSGGILVVRNLSRSLVVPIITTGIVGTHQMVFTNPITIIHVNKTVN